jgi:hypothetical protein
MYKSVMIFVCLMMSIVNPIMASSIKDNDTYCAKVEDYRIEVSFDDMKIGFAVMAKITRMKNSHTVNVSMLLKANDRATINLGLYFRENDVPLTDLGLLLIRNESYLSIEVGHIVSDRKFVKVHTDV